MLLIIGDSEMIDVDWRKFIFWFFVRMSESDVVGAEANIMRRRGTF
mgnify:CR=1 FL=1